MSGQQYGRYQTNPPPPAGFGSFPPPPGAMPSRSSGTQGTGGFGVPPPGAAGVPPPRPLAAGQMMSSSSAASTNTGVAGYQAPPALGTYGGASSNINFNAGPAYQRPPIGGGPSAYHQAPPPAVGGGTAMFHGSTPGSYQAPPPAVSSSASQLQSQEHPAVAGGTSDRMMYGAPPPPAAGFQQQQPTAATITSSLNQMSVSSSGAGPYAPPAAVPNQGQLNPNPPSSQFYPATPSRAQLSRFQGGGQATTSSAPPPPVVHDPFYTGGGSNAYPQQPMPQQQQQQPPPLMGGQLHPGGPRPLAVQPVSTTGPGGEFRHAMHQQPASAATGAQTFMEENPDWSIKHPEEMLHFTTTQIPQSAQLSTSSKVVLGGVLRPFAQCKDEVPTITPGPSGIIRCKKCRTYVNAFVSWFDNGRRWRCNICGQPNDCPSGYFCHLGDNNERRDKYDRPELCMSVVEYLAPSEYMVRPPPPPAYFFVMDVSAQAVASGMLAHVAAAIKAAIFGGEDDQAGLPGGERTQIGFLTYDTSVQYFNLSKRGRHKDDSPPQPQMLVVADLNELFVPLPPEDLLVNLEEHKDSVEAFLEALPTMFTASPRTSVQHDSCLGPALKAAFTIMKPIGGKMLVFDTMLPTLPFDGQLKPREANPRMMGTDAETSLLRGQSTWYKDTAVEFSRAQISVDLFLTNYNYIDVATLSDLSKYTAGNLYTFPNFSSNQDGARMEAEVFHTLVRPTALEAVMRVRCTRGMRVNNFYGNFFIRGSDLLALPNCTTESVFGFTMMHEDPMCPSNVLTFQSALLYTSTNGERRIRVLTTVLPVASSVPQITQSVHADVYCHLLSKQAVDYALKNGVGAARARLLQSCVDLIKTCRSASQKTSAEDKGIPPHLELMPLMIMGLLKNTAFRGGTDVHPDERCTSFNLISNLWVDERGKAYFYPRMFRVDQMPSDAGLPAATDDARPSHEAHNMHNEVFAGDEKIRLPSMMDLTVERLNSEGIYCLENGQDAFLWVGRQADPTLVHDLFSVESLENIEYSQISLRTSETDIACRLNAILSALQADTHGTPHVIIVREAQDEYLERKFLWHLVEDRAQFEHGTYTYQEFMQWVLQNTSISAQPFAGGAPPAAGAPRTFVSSSNPPGPSSRVSSAPPMQQAPGRQQMVQPSLQPMMPQVQQQMMQQQMMQQPMMPPPPQQQLAQPPQLDMRGPQQQPGSFPPPPGRFAAPPAVGPPAVAAGMSGSPASFGTQPPGPVPSFVSKGPPGPPPPMASSGPPSFNAPGPVASFGGKVPGGPPLPMAPPGQSSFNASGGGIRMPPPPPKPGSRT